MTNKTNKKYYSLIEPSIREFFKIKEDGDDLIAYYTTDFNENSNKFIKYCFKKQSEYKNYKRIDQCFYYVRTKQLHFMQGGGSTALYVVSPLKSINNIIKDIKIKDFLEIEFGFYLK